MSALRADGQVEREEGGALHEDGRPRRYLFHGTCRAIEGGALLPAMPSGDVGDPVFPVVFASEHLDFATMFSVKTPAVVHISGGSFPHVIVSGDCGEAEAAEGRVLILDSTGFSPAIPLETQNGKWWCRSPVPTADHRTVRILGYEHLVRLGVVVIHVRDRAHLRTVAEALRAPGSGAAWWQSLERLTRDGLVRSHEGSGGRSSLDAAHLQSLLTLHGSRGNTSNEVLERFVDSYLSPALPLRIRVRLTHGVDHACRTALLCRMLHNLLVAHGVMRMAAPVDLAALLVAAFFHDAARESDEGPDESASESAAFAEHAMARLGFSHDEARRAGQRIRHGTPDGEAVDLGGAILQTADAFELMRNYVGDIRLSETELFEVLRLRCPAAIPTYERLAKKYAEWLRTLEVWGLARGDVLGSDETVLVHSDGPVFDAASVFRRNLAQAPFASTRALLALAPELQHLYAFEAK